MSLNTLDRQVLRDAFFAVYYAATTRAPLAQKIVYILTPFHCNTNMERTERSNTEPPAPTRRPDSRRNDFIRTTNYGNDSSDSSDSSSDSDFSDSDSSNSSDSDSSDEPDVEDTKPVSSRPPALLKY